MLDTLNDPTGKQLVKSVIFTEFYGQIEKGKDIDDLMGQGFLGLARALKQNHHPHKSSFVTFAWLNIRHAIIEYLRQENTKNAAKTVPFEDKIDHRNKEDAVVVNETRQIISRAMKWLTRRQKAIIYEIYFNNLTEDETAETLEIGYSAVSEDKKKALLRLKNVLIEREALLKLRNIVKEKIKEEKMGTED